MTTHTARRKTITGILGTAVLGGLLASVLAAGPAAAIPPDGPGADTPGTGSSVSPRTLEPCQTISYTVTGYPGGETLYIKIDDGIGYGDTSVQGSGVWATQAIPASGTVSGSFELPCDITPGAHWLRFLASQYVDPADPGKGVLGFTRRGGADFTVVPATSGNPGGGSPGGSSNVGVGGQAPGAGQVVGSGSEQVAGSGGTLGIDPSLVAPTTVPAPPAESGDALPPTFDGKIAVDLDGADAVVTIAEDRAGQWVYVYAFSEPTGLGWKQVTGDGTVTVSTTGLEDGEHHLAVLDADGTLLGWSAVELGEPVAVPVVVPEEVAAPAEEAPGIPLVGLIVGGGIVLLGCVVTAWLLLTRRPRKTAAPGEAETGEDLASEAAEIPDREVVPTR